MAYITISDIEDEVGISFGTDTLPTETTVTSWIDDVENSIQDRVPFEIDTETVTDEVIDLLESTNIIDLDVKNVTNVSKLEINQGTEFNELWKEVETADYRIFDSVNGLVKTKYPIIPDYRKIRWSGSYGLQIPNNIKKATLYYVTAKVLRTVLNNHVFGNPSDISIGSIKLTTNVSDLSNQIEKYENMAVNELELVKNSMFF